MNWFIYLIQWVTNNCLNFQLLFGKFNKNKIFIVLLTVFSLFTIQMSCCLKSQIPLDSINDISKLYGKPYKVFGKWYYPIKHAAGFSEKGIASWYGKDFHGKKTANGEIYNMYGMTAAHKILPLGTIVRVKNHVNGKIITVRINDRGPFIDNRIIDLSYTAATKLDIVKHGTAPVSIQVVSNHTQPSQQNDLTISKKQNKKCYAVQVGAFQSKENAEKMHQTISSIFHDTYLKIDSNNQKTLYRVYVGKCLHPKAAVHYEKKLAMNGFADAFITSLNSL